MRIPKKLPSWLNSRLPHHLKLESIRLPQMPHIFWIMEMSQVQMMLLTILQLLKSNIQLLLNGISIPKRKCGVFVISESSLNQIRVKEIHTLLFFDSLLENDFLRGFFFINIINFLCFNFALLQMKWLFISFLFILPLFWLGKFLAFGVLLSFWIFRASENSSVVDHYLPLNSLFHLYFFNSLFKLFKVFFFVNLQWFNFINVTLPKLLENSWVIFWRCGGENRIDFKLLLLHFLMVTPALMRVSRFDKDCHQIEDVVEPSFGFYLKSFLEIFQKDHVFEFFFFTPVSFFLVRNQLFILLPLNLERHLLFFI